MVVVSQIGGGDVTTYVRLPSVRFKLFIWFVTKKLRVKKIVIVLVHQESGGVTVIETGVGLRGAGVSVLIIAVPIGQQTRHTLAMTANSGGALGEMKASVHAAHLTTPWSLIAAAPALQRTDKSSAWEQQEGVGAALILTVWPPAGRIVKTIGKERIDTLVVMNGSRHLGDGPLFVAVVVVHTMES